MAATRILAETGPREAGGAPRLLLCGTSGPLQGLAARLEEDGYDVITVADLLQAARETSASAPGVLLIDGGSPGLHEGLRRLKALSLAPILVLAGDVIPMERVALLEAGADDCVWAAAQEEVLARLRSLLRRSAWAGDEVQRIGPLGIDRARRQLSLDGVRVAVTPIEWDLLLLLARQPGRVVPRQDLLTHLWGAQHVRDTQYLRVHIGNLRRKLGRAGALIQTEPGVGFRLAELP